MTSLIPLNHHILKILPSIPIMRIVVNKAHGNIYAGISDEEMVKLYNETRDTLSRLPCDDPASQRFQTEEMNLRRAITYNWVINGPTPNNFHRDLVLRVGVTTAYSVGEVCRAYNMPMVHFSESGTGVGTMYVDISKSTEENFEEFMDFLISCGSIHRLEFVWRGISPLAQSDK